MRQMMLLLLFCLGQNTYAENTPIFEIQKPILNFHFEPVQPKVGQKISVFVQTETSFLNNEVVLEAKLNETTLKLTNTGDQLWSGVLVLLEAKLSEETDPALIQQLQEKINKINDLVVKLQTEKSLLFKEVGVSNHLNFSI
ncbi:hypothetical protein K2P97_04215 [bacterium]|nr:hypothetical protein [bacterium]